MPTYTFTRKSTGETWTTFCTIAERDVFVADDDIEQSICAPAFGDSSRMGVGRKPDGWLRDKFKALNKHHRGANLNTW